MDQFCKVLLAIDNAHTVPQKALDCGSGLGLLTNNSRIRQFEFLKAQSWGKSYSHHILLH